MENKQFSEFSDTRNAGTSNKSVGSKPFIILMTACITFAATLLLVYFCNNGFVFISRERYGDAREYIVLGEIIADIQNKFYGDTPTVDELVDASARAMVDKLNDPYAAYYTAQEFEDNNKSMNGIYSGLGVVIGVPDEVGSLISDVYDDSPAKKAGIQVGDIVTHIDGEAIGGYTKEQFQNMLVGEDGQTVKLTILRGTQTMIICVCYGTVTIDYVHYRMIGDTGYIQLVMFSNTVANDFKAALEDLQGKGMKSLVIDLRNNPGGSLQAVIDVADMILDGGNIVSVGRSMDDVSLEKYNATDGGLNGLPIAVLVNGNSASASEILAAAIQDNKAGVIIGKTTYGKGIVQTTMPLASSGAWLKFTTDAYFTPNGVCIHGVGITPDTDVSLPAQYASARIADIPEAEDTQLQAALKQLSGAAPSGS